MKPVVYQPLNKVGIFTFCLTYIAFHCLFSLDRGSIQIFGIFGGKTKKMGAIFKEEGPN